MLVFNQTPRLHMRLLTTASCVSYLTRRLLGAPVTSQQQCNMAWGSEWFLSSLPQGPASSAVTLQLPQRACDQPSSASCSAPLHGFAASALADGAPSRLSQASGSKRSKKQPTKASSKVKKESEQSVGPQGDDPDDQEEQYVHEHFNKHERLRRMQPVIEVSELKNSITGLVTSRWGYLYDTPLQRLTALLLARPIASTWHLACTPIYNRVAAITQAMVQHDVENEFDVEEFLEGAESAVESLMTAFAARDYDALHGMASDAIVESLRLSATALESDHRLLVRSIDTRMRHIAISGVNLWGPQSIRTLTPCWLDKISPESSKSWLVISVRVDVALQVELEREGADASSHSGAEEALPRPDAEDSMPKPRLAATFAGAGMSGQAPAPLQLSLDRRGTWLFARGPLPKGDVRSLDSKWHVLAWW